jgi:hypothetical protein
MFGRWRKDKEETGLTCPLCGEVSPEDTAECPKCYHQLGKSVLEQKETVGEEVSSSLFDELLAEEEDDDDDDIVDWSKHTFGMDDVTIDVSQYEEDSESVSLSAAPNFAAIENDAPVAAKPTPKDLDDGEYELKLSDAPKDVEKFVVPKTAMEDPLVEPEHKIDLVVPLLPKDASSSDDEGPLEDPSEVPEEEPEVVAAPAEEEPEVVAAPAEEEPEVVAAPAPVVPQEATPNPAPSSPEPVSVPVPVPALPTTPQSETQVAPVVVPQSAPRPAIPQLPGQSAAANGATAPQLPATPIVPSTPALPTPPSAKPDANAFNQDMDLDVDPQAESSGSSPPSSVDDQMWPWSQKDAFDDLTVRRELRQVMEAVKEGDLDGAARNLDKLGPHLGDRKEILFHVGVVLKKLGREEALRKMLEAARRLHPEDQHVATALTSLGM